jgi:hypothetical protein
MILAPKGGEKGSKAQMSLASVNSPEITSIGRVERRMNDLRWAAELRITIFVSWIWFAPLS